MNDRNRGLRLHYGLLFLRSSCSLCSARWGLARFGYTSILPAMQQGLGLVKHTDRPLQTLIFWAICSPLCLPAFLPRVLAPALLSRFPCVVVSLSMIMTGLVPTFGSACVGRFLAGLGGAGANIPAMGLCPHGSASRRRGLASGIGVTGSSLGLMITGPLVPRLSQPAALRMAHELVCARRAGLGGLWTLCSSFYATVRKSCLWRRLERVRVNRPGAMLKKFLRL